MTTETAAALGKGRVKNPRKRNNTKNKKISHMNASMDGVYAHSRLAGCSRTRFMRGLYANWSNFGASDNFAWKFGRDSKKLVPPNCLRGEFQYVFKTQSA